MQFNIHADAICAPYISVQFVKLAESFGISKEVVATSILADFLHANVLEIFFCFIYFNVRAHDDVHSVRSTK